MAAAALENQSKREDRVMNSHWSWWSGGIFATPGTWWGASFDVASDSVPVKPQANCYQLPWGWKYVPITQKKGCVGDLWCYLCSELERQDRVGSREGRFFLLWTLVYCSLRKSSQYGTYPQLAALYPKQVLWGRDSRVQCFIACSVDHCNFCC